MKTICVLLAVCLLSMSAYTQQTVKETLAKGRVVSWSIKRLIENDKDTIVYFYWGYQNKKYTQIRDIGSVFFYEKSELKLFAEKLIEYCQMERGKSISYSIGDFKISLFDFSNEIYIEDDENKYTTISKRNAQVLSAEIMQHIDLLIK